MEPPTSGMTIPVLQHHRKMTSGWYWICFGWNHSLCLADRHVMRAFSWTSRLWCVQFVRDYFRNKNTTRRLMQSFVRYIHSDKLRPTKTQQPTHVLSIISHQISCSSRTRNSTYLWSAVALDGDDKQTTNKSTVWMMIETHMLSGGGKISGRIFGDENTTTDGRMIFWNRKNREGSRFITSFTSYITTSYYVYIG